MKSYLPLFTISFCLLVACAQELPDLMGDISGYVEDSYTQTPIAGVKVSITPGNESVLTGSEGDFSFIDLEAGKYVLAFSKEGYIKQQKNVNVKAGSEIDVQLSMNPIQPELSINVSELDFGKDNVTLAFDIINRGKGSLEWNISEDLAWISCEPNKGTTTNESSSVVVSAHRDDLKEGTHKGSIVITSNGGSYTIPVSLDVEKIHLEITPLELDFGTSVSSLQLTLKNTGSTPTKYTAKSMNNWLVLDKTSGTVSSTVYLSAIVSREGLSAGKYSSSIEFNIEDNEFSIPIAMEVLADEKPVVSLEAVEEVTYSSAEMRGTIVSIGSSTISEFGFCWSESTNPTIDDKKTNSGDCSSPMSFEGIATDLNPSTTYHVRAYAKNNVGVAYSNKELKFTTQALPTIPTVKTGEITDITSKSLKVKGSIISLGNVACINEYGHILSTNAEPTLHNGKYSTLGKTSDLKSFESTFSKLEVNTRYYIRAYASNEKGTAYGDIISCTTGKNDVIVSISDITDIIHNAATCHVKVSYDGGHSISETGVCWGEAKGPTLSESHLKADGNYSCRITGLTKETVYYARAYAMTSEGIVFYGDDYLFETTVEVKLPTLAGLSVSDIKATSVYANCKITSDGNSLIQKSGFCFSTEQSPTIETGSVATAELSQSAITMVIDELKDGTTYYIRAYATNAMGVAYSDEVRFTTDYLPVRPTVTTGDIYKINKTSIQIKGSIKHLGYVDELDGYGFVWSTKSDPTLESGEYINLGKATTTKEYEAELTNLDANTTYYIRAYATNQAGTAYGAAVTGTTSKEDVQLLVSSITEVDHESAKIAISIENNNYHKITETGVCWSVDKSPSIEGKSSISNDSYICQISGLKEVTVYYVRAYAKTEEGLIFYSKNYIFETTHEIALPKLGSLSLTNITTNSITAACPIISNGYSDITENGFCYSTIKSPDIEVGTIVKADVSQSQIIKAITELQAAKTYYIRAYAKNRKGVAYSDELSFTTANNPIAPTVTTGELYETGKTHISIKGNIKHLGYVEELTKHGFVWGTQSELTLDNGECIDLGTAAETKEFKTTIKDLKANTTYYIRAFATNKIGTGYGDIISGTTTKEDLVLSISSITDIDHESAKAVVSIDSMNGHKVVEKGVCWSTSKDPTITDNVAEADDNSICSVTGLKKITAYYVRAYVKTDEDIVFYSNNYTFETTQEIVVPELGTLQLSDITMEGVTAACSIVSNGYSDITENGFCYSKAKSPTLEAAMSVQASISQSEISKVITGLDDGETYYIKAYAKNIKGTAYSEELSFTTKHLPVIPTVTTGDIYETEKTSISIRGSLDHLGYVDALEGYGFVWNTQGEPTLGSGDFSNLGNATETKSFEYRIPDLLSNTKYYIRAYATNQVGTAYGTVISTTTAKADMVLSISSISDISHESAKAAISIENSNGHKVTEKGVCWSTSKDPAITDNIAEANDNSVSAITGLEKVTSYYLRAYAKTDEGLVFYSKNYTFETTQEFTIPELGSITLTNITTNGVTAVCPIVSNGYTDIIENGFCYSTMTSPDLETGTVITTEISQSQITKSITGLDDGKTYYIRAYARNAKGISYSNETNFTTETIYLPTVGTINVKNVGKKSAVVSSTIESDGNSNILERGFCWSINSYPTVNDNKVACEITGDFSTNLQELPLLTTVYVRAYATNLKGTNYGQEAFFTTVEYDSDVWDGNVATAFGGGMGTVDSPIIINTGSQLKLLANKVNSGTSYSGVYFKLDANIDLNNISWTPIGTSTNPFRGSLDGSNLLISGLKISSNNYSGLFGYISGGMEYIKDLSISGVVNGENYVAGLCGCVYFGNGIINNCHSYCDVTGNNSVGGLIGLSRGGVPCINCSNHGTVTGSTRVGGIVGGSLELSSREIFNCLNFGDIIGSSHTGGIVGYFLSDKGGIKNCVNYSALPNNYGGIAGYVCGNTSYSPTCVTNCFWLNDIVNNVGAQNGIREYESTKIEGTNYFMRKSDSCVLASGEDVVDKLNSWIDSNTDGNTYRRWKYETIDGYPVPTFE